MFESPCCSRSSALSVRRRAAYLRVGIRADTPTRSMRVVVHICGPFLRAALTMLTWATKSSKARSPYG